MRLNISLVGIGILTALAASASVEPASSGTSFTSTDMWKLSSKLVQALNKKCKLLRSHPNIVVGLENATPEFIDKTQFSEQIHSLLEAKSHIQPETTPPQYEIDAKLESTKKLTRLMEKNTYTLSADVLQADEKLCTRKVSLIKRNRLNDIPEMH
jgi:hypothetical protein